MRRRGNDVPFCPEYLTPEDDLPHVIGDEPRWSENYLSHAVFPEAGCAHWLHLGRTAFDPHCWQEFLTVYLPGDRFLCAKGVALLPSDRGPQGPSLVLRCDEPFRQWTKSYHGLARLVTGDDLRVAPLADGLSVGVDMQMIWTARAPAFDMEMVPESWGQEHYEQDCTVSGHLEFGGERIALEGTGLRDHSWGPRDLAPIDHHCWIHGQWPDGRSFMVSQVLTKDGDLLSHVSMDDGEGRLPGTLISRAPLIDDFAWTDDPYTLRLETKRGISEIHAQVQQVAAFSPVGTRELVHGRDRGSAASHHLGEGTTRFDWDGDVGWGLTERSVRNFR